MQMLYEVLIALFLFPFTSSLSSSQHLIPDPLKQVQGRLSPKRRGRKRGFPLPSGEVYGKGFCEKSR
jgi:hypothetical protein